MHQIKSLKVPFLLVSVILKQEVKRESSFNCGRLHAALKCKAGIDEPGLGGQHSFRSSAELPPALSQVPQFLNPYVLQILVFGPELYDSWPVPWAFLRKIHSSRSLRETSRFSNGQTLTLHLWDVVAVLAQTAPSRWAVLCCTPRSEASSWSACWAHTLQRGSEIRARLRRQLAVGLGSRGGKQGGSPAPQGCVLPWEVHVSCGSNLLAATSAPIHTPICALLHSMSPDFVHCPSGDIGTNAEFPAGP